jgi:hypothetical protein
LGALLLNFVYRSEARIGWLIGRLDEPEGNGVSSFERRER